jgi:hypothetical protein
MAKGQQKQRQGAVNDGKAPGHQQGPKKVRPQVIHGDLYQRANFTFQASAFLQQLQVESGPGVQRSPLAGEPISDSTSDSTKKHAPHFTQLSRNMMAANGKMVIHNQMKL